MTEKAMVSDALVGVNGELKMFGDMIPQTENKELKQLTIVEQVEQVMNMDNLKQEIQLNKPFKLGLLFKVSIKDSEMSL